MVREGEFREDLLFRLKVIEMRVPPLRDRRSDIPLLARHILAKSATELGRQAPGISREVMAYLLSQDWPGNVREMENALTRAMVMSRGSSLSLSDVEGDHWSPTPRQASRPERAPEVASSGSGILEEDSLADVERRHVQRVLALTKGNKSAAARILEVSRPTLNRMIKDYEIVVP
jgi:DNA-binding NtrC family response regulator